MANQAVSFDDIIQEGRRKKAAEKLAQEIFGRKGGRSSAPPNGPKAGLGGSLASRVGVTKRNPSLPRSTTPRLNPRASLHSRPLPPAANNNDSRPRIPHTRTAPNGSLGPSSTTRENIDDVNGEVELSIKGAASGPYTVVAQNFEPGTTAADIESVMLSVGGEMTQCRLVASLPTVIAEMTFVEKRGAEKVIETFNGKKADGRPLYVYWQHNGGARQPTADQRQPLRAAEPAATVFEVQANEDDVAMEVDGNAQAREAEDRRREERRDGRDDRGPRDAYPTGPRGYRGGEPDRYDHRRPRSMYQGGWNDRWHDRRNDYRWGGQRRDF